MCAYLADSDGIRPDARRYPIIAADDPRVAALIALDTLCERVLRRVGRADLLTPLAVTGGTTPGGSPGATAPHPTPQSSSRPDAALTASGSPSAIRDGVNVADVPPSTIAVTPHLFAGSGESRNEGPAGLPTPSVARAAL